MIDPEQFEMILAIAVLPRRHGMALQHPLIMASPDGMRTNVIFHRLGIPEGSADFPPGTMAMGEIERQAHARIDDMSQTATLLQAHRPGPATPARLSDVWRD